MLLLMQFNLFLFRSMFFHFADEAQQHPDRMKNTAYLIPFANIFVDKLMFNHMRKVFIMHILM